MSFVQDRFLQMAGESGTGKSTLARALGRVTGAVVLDKDAIKTPLMEEGLEDVEAGGYSFPVLFSLTRSLLEVGHNVILDSPAFYPSILERGRKAAEEHNVSYYVIECHCSDVLQHETRLRTRDRRISQPSSLDEVIRQRTLPNRAGITEPHLLLDTSHSLDLCVQSALSYMGRI